MQRHCTRPLFALIAILMCLGSARPVYAQFTYTVLHNFGDGSVTNDGALSETSLIQGTDGNFYGTTLQGGSANEGTVFKMTPSGTVTILHSFGDGSVVNDGQQPDAKLLQGIDGNFYGTTEIGGAPIPAGNRVNGTVGTVFKMTPAGVVTILHSFGPGCLKGDGANPQGALAQTPDGTLYGAAYTAGNAPYPDGFGVIFSINPSGTYTILHVMKLADGAGPKDLIASPDGNFCGVAIAGGGSNDNPGGFGLAYGGTFFKVTPSGQLIVLDDFPSGNSDGDDSPADLFFTADGTFYCYTFLNNNAFFTAERPAGGSPIFGTYGQINTTGGQFTIDLYGNLYTSASSGSDGEIEVATPDTTNTVAWSFSGTDGKYPNAVVVGKDGDLYGTTSVGGSANDGVIFKLHNATPPYGPASTLNIAPSYTDPNGVETGSPLSFTVTALDSDGRIAAGYTGTVHFTSDDPKAILPSVATLTNGVGTFQATFSVPNTLTATDTVTPSITASSFINVIVARTFQVTVPANVIPGVPFNVTVTALDAFGGVVTGYAGTVQFASTDSAATLPANANLTNGVGTFSVTLRTPGHQNVSAADTVISSVAGGAYTYVQGPATNFVVTAPADVAKGKAFNVVVTAYDAFGFVATAYTGTVHFTCSQSGATLPADAKLTNGVGTFGVTLATLGVATRITVTDTVTSSLKGQTGVIVVFLAQFGAGWQMVATPFNGGSASSVFSNSVISILAYNGTEYATLKTLEAGLGFWIVPVTPPTFLLNGTLSPRPITHGLHKGWNIIGNPYTTAEPASSILVNGKAFLGQSSVIAQVTYTWQSGDTAYETMYGSGITLQPYVGYWVYAYAPCAVTFN